MHALHKVFTIVVLVSGHSMQIDKDAETPSSRILNRLFDPRPGAFVNLSERFEIRLFQASRTGVWVREVIVSDLRASQMQLDQQSCLSNAEYEIVPGLTGSRTVLNPFSTIHFQSSSPIQLSQCLSRASLPPAFAISCCKTRDDNGQSYVMGRLARLLMAHITRTRLSSRFERFIDDPRLLGEPCT
jgi:hypothetical protein